jgi:choline dehydrogenase-like flavoprotein
MTTSAQIAANKSNAQRSTGPKTPEGKAISSLNRFKHGCTGAFTVLPWESQDEFEMLIDSLRDEHKPCGVTEMILVDKMAQALWLSKRAQMLQHVAFNQEIPVCDDPKQLALYLRYETTNERAFHKCLNDLLKLRAEKRRQEIGFESQRRKQADQTRRESSENRKQELHKWSVLLAEAKVDHQLLLNSTLESTNEPAEDEEEAPITSEIAA